MQVRPRGHEIVEELLRRGVDLPNPLTLDIGPEVDPDRISADGVTIHPGCRIRGAGTVISAGVTLGAEAPVTLDNCRLGPSVELKGGFFSRSVFLEKSSMGSGAQVREGTLLEEEAGGAHCVGLKQTILFPFVTLGSLINFCDCLMSGGTSRKDHGEVGSSYIHFNFTPDGDKTTASLFGDVPRGVMLDQRPIFLGGQGGTVGPVRTGFGTVVAAGSILRNDVLEDNTLVLAKPLPGLRRPVAAQSYKNLAPTVTKNLQYLAGLVALEQWYLHVRKPFFDAQELGPLVFEGALEVIAAGRSERAKRLAAMVAKVPGGTGDTGGRDQLRERIGEVLAVFESPPGVEPPTEFLKEMRASADQAPTDYLTAVRHLSSAARQAGTGWLQKVIDDLCAQTAALVPSMKLFVRT
ncbi:MAG: bifunctional UDP-N-acetylglucosamine pyrophosphorylase / glucosamine-phosphate N-acetyltransferase [Actinomycetota bacterium]|nr:bifunctional UDP-N-acetylglucosamine pyrophosphorylase / glucosamine-phosphate N-acetyltransferase [Actinomycetota bacterium]